MDFMMQVGQAASSGLVRSTACRLELQVVTPFAGHPRSTPERSRARARRFRRPN